MGRRSQSMRGGSTLLTAMGRWLRLWLNIEDGEYVEDLCVSVSVRTQVDGFGALLRLACILGEKAGGMYYKSRAVSRLSAIAIEHACHLIGWDIRLMVLEDS
ncbi:hypothetical protein Tco_0898137 [Tanacetum coccineum]